jgi:hypothetical protein
MLLSMVEMRSPDPISAIPRPAKIRFFRRRSDQDGRRQPISISISGRVLAKADVFGQARASLNDHHDTAGLEQRIAALFVVTRPSSCSKLGLKSEPEHIEIKSFRSD